jgi:anoctamin-8
MGAMPAMLGLCIPILNLILTKISIMLNNFENYRTESEYRTHLIIKVFSFRIVSQLGTVYYYAFKSTGTREAVENNFIKMGTSVMVYTTVAHWWNIILQVYFFMLVRNIRRRIYRQKLRTELKNIELLEEEHVANHRSDAEAREIRLINKRMLLDQAQDDLWFEIMNPPHDSFPEYITAVVQFTFVACFSVILPITPFLVLVNYLLNMRFDAYKLCRGRRRPLAKRTGGIGVWEHLLHVVSVLGVLTNCWLIATTNSNFAKLAEQVGETATFVIIVAWEHIMLLIKYTMTATISPLPKEVRDEMKRKQYEIDQERYADMRLKKERSRRSKIQKSASFADSCSEVRSRITKESVRDKTDFGHSEIPSQDQYSTPSFSSKGRAGYQGKGPLLTIPSVDEDSQPGQLFEC